MMGTIENRIEHLIRQANRINRPEIRAMIVKRKNVQYVPISLMKKTIPIMSMVVMVHPDEIHRFHQLIPEDLLLIETVEIQTNLRQDE